VVGQRDDISALIREKILAGTLPKEAPLTFFAGYGTGKICDACDLPTTKTDVECEVDMEDGRTLVFHQPCLALWHQERAAYLQP
jgi:hypothetical protein